MRCSFSLIRRGSRRAICAWRMGRLLRVGADVVAAPGDEIVDCGGAVLMPGLVNGHTHLYSALAAGMPAPPRPPRNFHEILKFIWWRLDRAHTLESVEMSGADRRAGGGALRHDDAHRSSRLAERDRRQSVGARKRHRRGRLPRCACATKSPTAIGRTKRRQGLPKTNATFANVKQRADGRFAGMVGAHASFTLEEESLVGCVELARRLNVGVHIHAAEDPVDEQITRERFGCGLIERFKRVGLLDVPGTIFGSRNASVGCRHRSGQ